MFVQSEIDEVVLTEKEEKCKQAGKSNNDSGCVCV
jgi:hypothetical protein